MRVSRADREQTVDVLKAAFVHERLTEDNLVTGSAARWRLGPMRISPRSLPSCKR